MKKYLKLLSFFLAGLLSLYLIIILILSQYTNFHTVISGQVYRSAQLDKAEFLHVIHQYHIKTIVNLRGENDARWYREEISASKLANVKHYNVRMHAKGLNSPDNLLRLKQIILTAPKPLLIHCWHGADRTGLASAMSVILLTDQSFAKAQKQISFRFLALSPSTTGKVELEHYQMWLSEHHLKHSRQHFIDWLQQLNNAS